MRKKKKSIYKATVEDADFVNSSDVRDFALAYPEEFDDFLDKIQRMVKNPQHPPELGSTPLEFILRRLEKEAKDILTKNGYPTDLNELTWLESEKTYPVKSKIGGTTLKIDLNIEILSAKRVLFSAVALRDAIANSKAEQAAIDMMRLIYAAISADMFEVIITGVRAKAGQKKGGEQEVDKNGYYGAIRQVLELKNSQISLEDIWRYFKIHHKENNPMEIGDYEIFYDQGKLYQVQDGAKETERAIYKSTLKKYLTNIRPKAKKIAQ